MLLSLSLYAITDIIHAHAALELLTVNDEESRRILTPLLDRDHPAPLMMMTENTFAETILHLIPYIRDVELPAADTPTDSDRIMQIDLRLPDSFSPSLTTLLRRKLELAIAMGVLAAALTATSPATPALASVYAERHHQALTSLLSLLRKPSKPFIRNPW